MVKHKKLGMAVAGAFALFGVSGAHAFGPIKAGDWDLSVSGEVNAFYTMNHCDTNGRAVAGGLACATAGASDEPARQSEISSGLLPSALVFSAKTTQEGFDIGVTFGFYPGIANTNGIGNGNSALANSTINMRQNFLTFGDKEMGTIKMGRDLGLFGSDAILSDVTLLGVGAPSQGILGSSTNGPFTTSLGRIGTGYIYADWIPQITYITPSFDGFQLSAGVFQPLTMSSGVLGGGQTATGHSVPMFQAKGTYDFKVNEDIKSGRIWGSGLYQRGFCSSADGCNTNNVGVTAFAGDVGIKANVFGFEPVLYYYQGRGVGTTGLFSQSFDATGGQRNSKGGYAQVSHAFGKWKPSFSYGLSELFLGSGEQNTAASSGNVVKFNKMRTQQLQYSLTKALTLVEEFSTIRSSAQGGGVNGGTGNYATAISVGAILFF